MWIHSQQKKTVLYFSQFLWSCEQWKCCWQPAVWAVAAWTALLPCGRHTSHLIASDCAGEREGRQISVCFTDEQPNWVKVSLFLFKCEQRGLGFSSVDLRTVTSGLLFFCKTKLQMRLNVAAQTNFLVSASLKVFWSHARLQDFSPADLICCAQPVGWPAGRWATNSSQLLMELLDVHHWWSKSGQLLHFMSGRCETLLRMMPGGPRIWQPSCLTLKWKRLLLV